MQMQTVSNSSHFALLFILISTISSNYSINFVGSFLTNSSYRDLLSLQLLSRNICLQLKLESTISFNEKLS